MEKMTTASEISKLTHIFLEMAEEMLLSGAEIARVEDTVTRLGLAYGMERVNILVITSCIVLTLTDCEGNDYTNTKRISKPAGTDFTKLGRLNELSRECCSKPMNPEDLARAIRTIAGENQGLRRDIRNYVGSALIASAFAIFFGGTIYDGLAGIFGGLLVYFLQRYTERFCPNRTAFNLISSFLVGAVICLAAGVFPMLHPDMIIIGVIMLQIPGVAMTISFRDVIVGETISGTLRLIESMAWATALACGFMLAIALAA